MLKHLDTNDNLNEIIQKGVCLVDFYTTWCGPCKMQAEVLEDIDFIDIYKVDCEKFMDLSTKYGVMSVPTLCFFKNGELVKKEIGYRSLEEIKDIYDEISEN